eukprot:CAMPEP_0201929344 /NCGR_PEP_ID=MMETSP0903-20130614/22812_1 /ASSEMBLY_ACC=CAM_ASM_000552 /TAXON_ID=420261 /ORGANISM="Thalassiosira antarctica, Strain CCMP982" /LENGTH=408 /DNA_ID=CAMNT_0048468087 /DNA_START=60 /DNA_END=1283 /DNA_ORIENTATION=+
MTKPSSHRLTSLTFCCHLLIAFLLFDGSFAAPSQLLLQSTTNAVQRSSLRHQSNDESSGVAFLHRARRNKASCKAIIGCSGVIGAGNGRDESSTLLMESIVSIRGGASSSDNNAVQNILKSLLASSLPSPIKQLIEMICQFIEKLTGWNVLPHAQKKKKSKAKNRKSKEREVVVEEVRSVGSKKKRRSKHGEKKVDDLEEVATAGARKKKRRSPQPKPTTLETNNTKPTTPEKASSTTTTATTTPPKKTQKPKRPDPASKKFLSNTIKSSNPNYRIQRELKEFLKSPPPGLSVKISGKNVRLWVITLSMPENTIYSNEKYRLRVQFPNDYPTSPPSVYFLNPTPRHEHVYTNGDICLSLLGKDWRPIMTAQMVAQAIMSILCGAQRKSLPMDNARHAGNQPGKKQDDW